jgi:hypothetical protein
MIISRKGNGERERNRDLQRETNREDEGGNFAERENEILKNEQNEEGREKRVQFSNVRRDCL